ncbi:MAG TPA: hypothetical protein VNJ71_05735 [Gemmatimonadales bacterium]|nr:hypothetical protein [Gemmatimonadales bacterium]
MAGILDRLNKELESFGKKAQAALDEGKLRLERLRLQRERDQVASRLGYAFHRRERGQAVDQYEIEKYLQQLDELGNAIARVERELASVRAETVSVGDAPPPGASAPAEAAVVEEGRSPAAG